MSAARVREDLLKIKRQPGFKFIGFQEIDEADPADEHAILNQVYRRQKKVGMRHMDPIVAPVAAKIVSHKVTKATDGIGGVTPTRYITAAVFEFRGKRFAHVNTHYPAFAWNGKNESFQKEVMSAWQEQFRAHQDIVDFYVRQGLTTFWTGDVNRVDMPKVHHDERRLWTRGIDSISVVERNFEFRVKDKGAIALNSDHDACWVSGDLLPKK